MANKHKAVFVVLASIILIGLSLIFGQLSRAGVDWARDAGGFTMVCSVLGLALAIFLVRSDRESRG